MLPDGRATRVRRLWERFCIACALRRAILDA